MKKRITACMLSLVLAASVLAPVGTGTIAGAAAVRDTSADHMIDEMLEGREFVSGEAVAVLRNKSAYSDEELLSVAGSDDEFFIRHIKEHKLTTRQLLKKLYADPDVISAEPNYIKRLDDETDGISGPEAVKSSRSATVDTDVAESTDAAETDTHISVNSTEDGKNTSASASYDPGSVGDLSGYQWYTSTNNSKKTKTPNASSGMGVSLEIPGWNGDADNSSGTIAIMDTGIDTTHPDLKDSLFTFTEEQQERFGCGPHGINMEPSKNKNKSNAEKAKDVSDHMMHGTHIAGIIAGAWNGYGISGIAKGVKLFAVKVFADDGNGQDSTNQIRGFEWLCKVAKEVNLKAVNISLGSLSSQLVHKLMTDKLGRQGVNVIYASGNTASDLDEDVDMGGQNDSPYAITVNAADQDGMPVDIFSSKGQSSTDVYAPGVQMLSTIPNVVTEYNDNDELRGYTDHTRVFANKTAASHIAGGSIEKFSDGAPRVLFYDSCPITEDGRDNAKAKRIGSLATGAGLGTDDENSWQIRWKDMKSDLDSGHYMTGGYPVSRNFWAAVPVEDGKTPAWLTYTAAVNDGSHIYSGMAGLICSVKDAKGNIVPKHIDMHADDSLGSDAAKYDPGLVRGVAKSATTSLSSVMWAPGSFNIDAFIKELKYIHTKLNKKEIEALTWQGDPGDVTGVYNWEKNGKKYLLFQYGTIMQEGGKEAFSDSTMLYMDDIAVMDDQAAAGPYAYLNGTSMAAPTVAAIMSIIAKDEPHSSTLTEEQLSMEAVERAAKLRACVDYRDEMKKKCQTGGMVNLHSQTEFTKKAPVIASKKVTDDMLTLTGYFFGENGELYIDDVKKDALNRTDTEITVELKDVSAGSHVITIVNQDEKKVQTVVGVIGDKLYENSYSLPFADPKFESDNTEMFSGRMVATNKYIFVMGTAHVGLAQGLWRYTKSDGTWKRCADLPTGLKGYTSEPNGMVIRGNKLYVYSCKQGLDVKKGGLYSYDIAGNKWKKAINKNLPTRNQLFLIGKQLFLTDGQTIKKINIKTGKLKKVKIKMPYIESVDESSIAVSSNKLYIYGYRYDKNYNKTYVLYRFTYKKKKNTFKIQNLSKAVKTAFGSAPGDAVITTVSGGIAIIGPVVKTNGYRQDTHILKDNKKKIRTIARTSCYHKVFNPVAVYSKGLLYVLGVNDTESDGAFFRSTKL